MKCLLKASPVGLLSGTVLLGLLLVSYAPVLFCEYGQWDDYPFIWDSISGNSYGVGNNFMWFTGRIPWAILYPYVFDAAGSIAGLFWIRCLSVFLLWGLGLCLLHSLRQAGLGLAVSLLGVSVALVNPSMGAVVSWAAAMSMLIGNFISALAAILFNRYYELQNTWRGQLKICLLTSSLLLASAFFYQVSAGFFMVLLFAFVQRTQKKQTGFFCRKSTAGALCLAVAYVSYAIIFWTLIDPHFHSPQHSGIATLDLDIKGKFLILSDQVGLTAMSGWLWFWGNSLALLAAGALLLVFAVSISIRKAQAKVYLYQLFLAVGMVCGPIVALSYQEDLPFRILGPVYGLVGVWLATSISAVLDFSTLGLKKFLNAGLFACIGINAVLGAIFIYEGIVKQHSSELAAVRTAITEVSRAGVPEEIVFIPPPAIFEKHTTIFPVRGRQEYFGWHSTTAFWTIKPLVNLVLNENKQIAPSADGPSIRLLME